MSDLLISVSFENFSCIKNISKEYVYTALYKSQILSNNPVRCTCRWITSPEGRDYWTDLSNKYLEYKENFNKIIKNGKRF